jgi:hypothetical protein
MAEYEPIETGIPFRAGMSELVAFRWHEDGIEAEFKIEEDNGRAIKVSFDAPCIVRLLDELSVSTEDNGSRNTGLIPQHFAYRVKNAAFERMQSWAWKELNGDPKHYQFLTGSACMDVLSGAEPSFNLVIRPPSD